MFNGDIDGLDYVCGKYLHKQNKSRITSKSISSVGNIKEQASKFALHL